MMRGKRWNIYWSMGMAGAFLLAAAVHLTQAEEEPGFIPLFNGKNFDGWIQKGAGYVVRDGLLICPEEGGGVLLTEREYENFAFRFGFRLSEGAHHGVALRAPARGVSAYQGIQVEMLDDYARKWSGLRPARYSGSIYGVKPAFRGALKRAGEWNEKEIICLGRRIQVKLNGEEVLNADLNMVTSPVTLQKHPGLLRQRGHVGLVGAQDYIEFRNIRIKEFATFEEDNVAPPGFVALFNGRDLSGWKGLVGDPVKRGRMSAQRLERAQQEADDLMRRNWRVEEGTLVYHGKGFDNLCTGKDYGDFELLVDWKIAPKGDSGIYLRSTPQVQMWDHPEGSGGLWNNKRHPSKPLQVADNPVGEWNRFRILLMGDKVTVYLNEKLVVHNVTLENYWQRHRPLSPVGAIELQAHRDKVWFKNIFIRELPRLGN
jgi:hypothetical protein